MLDLLVIVLPLLLAVFVIMLLDTPNLLPQQPRYHLLIVALLGVFGALWGIKSLVTKFRAPNEAFVALLLDPQALLFCNCALLTVATALLLGFGALQQPHPAAVHQGTFLSLSSLLAIAMVLMIAAADLMLMFIGLELLSIASYPLAGLVRNSRRGQEACVKYFVVSAVAGACCLFGLSLLFAAVGKTHQPFIFANLGLLWQGATLPTRLGFFMVFLGLCGKMALVPYHLWAADVYEGTSASVSGVLAVTVKIAVAAVLLRLLQAIAVNNHGVLPEQLLQALGLMALVSIFYGNLLALRQLSLKRLLGYSSVAHSGYVLLAVLAQATLPTPPLSLTYFFLGYSFATLGAFAQLGSFAWLQTTPPLTLQHVQGIAAKQPWGSAWLTIFLLALAGIPPTAGFLGKLALLKDVAAAGMLGSMGLAVAASLIGAIAYFRVIVALYSPKSVVAPSSNTPVFWPWQNSCIGCCALGTLLLGIFPNIYQVMLTWLSLSVP